VGEVRVVVREAGRDWSGTMHGSDADRAIAALSADPTSLEEFEIATARFAQPDPQRRYFADLSPGLCDEPYDSGLVIIDLVARLVVVDSTSSSPGPEGTVAYHNGRCGTQTELRYHLADDWLFSRDTNSWRSTADARRRERDARPPLDSRAVFYGQPMLEFIARGGMAAFARCEEIAAAAQPIHAAWLLTPRDDLGGGCPREVALDRRDHLMRDLQDRCEHWALLGECPRGLEASSHAFQYGGFGTHELVLYYHLVRELIRSCWEQLIERVEVAARRQPLTFGDFPTTEVPRLEGVRDLWLDTPDSEFQGRTPRSIIDRERARLPEVIRGHDALVDPDCPCCQMIGEMPGPTFWHLDGSNMDDDFAFDMNHRTRQEWDEERRSWEEHSRRFNAEWAERERLGVTDSIPSSESIWSRSMFVGDTVDLPLGTRVFALGSHLAELIVGLRADAARESIPRETQQPIDQLNRDFGNLREILQSSDLSRAVALIDPVLDHFAETLATVAAARPDLARQCESLTDKLRTLLDPPSSKQAWNPCDPEIPF
jgi:hypothetical protein